MQLPKSPKKPQAKLTVISKAYTSTKELITNFISTKSNQHIIGNYKYFDSDLIGKGYSSKVYKGSALENEQTKYAIKVMDITSIKSFLLQLLKKQIKIHLKLNHQNVVKCYDVIQTPTTVYLILQYCSGGDLSQLLCSKKKINEGQALKIMHQIVEGYKYLIKQNVLHRDLKPSNIIKSGRKWKIADFGFATKNDQLDDINVGTPIYMPPEALKNSLYSHKSDFFSLGVIMYQLVYGKVPWYSKSQQILQKKMNQQKLDLQKNKTVFSIRIKNFINKCCEIQPKKRISEQEFLNFQLWSQKKRFQIDPKIEKAISTGKQSKTKSKSKSKTNVMNNGFSFNLNGLKFKEQAKTVRQNSDNNNTRNRVFGSQIDENDDFLKLNKQILNQEVDFCKHLYYMIKNMKHFNLEAQNKDILTILLFKHIIFLMKKLSNDKFNYFQFKKWNNFKKVHFYQVMRNQISLNLNLTQKQYLKYLKHKDIKIIRIVNKKFPELSHQAEFNKKFYKNLSQFLKELIHQFTEINLQIITKGYSNRLKQVKDSLMFGSLSKNQIIQKKNQKKISKEKITKLKSLGSVLSNFSDDNIKKEFQDQQKKVKTTKDCKSLNQKKILTLIQQKSLDAIQNQNKIVKSQAKLKIMDFKKYNQVQIVQMEPFTEELLKIPKATIQCLSSLYHYYAVTDNKACFDNNNSFSMIYVGYEAVQQSNICLIRDYEQCKLQIQDYTKIKNLTKFL